MSTSRIAMIVLTIVQIPSLCCALIVFVNFIQRTSPLRRLQNHLLICLLIFATYTIIIDLPNTQNFLWTGSVTIRTYEFCIFWGTSFSVMAAINRFLIAFMSIERHLLVFHPQVHRTRRSRFVFHYSPPSIIIVIIVIYITVTNIFVKCSLSFNYSAFLCGFTCAAVSQSYGTFSIWFFVFIPTVLTAIASISLPIRFIIQKRQLQRVRWDRARKMIIQTSLIAGTYTICWLPYTILLQLVINRNISFVDPVVNGFLTYTPYVTSLLTPIIVLHAVSASINLQMIEVIKRRLFLKHQAIVQRISTVSRPVLNPLNVKYNTKDDTSL